MSAIKMRGLDHVVLRVTDLERAKVFYRDVLGCTEDKWQPDLGLMQMRAGAALIDLVDINGKLGQRGGPPAGTQARNLDHFCIQLTEFDESALRAYLATHGIEVHEAGRRYGAEGYGPSLYIRDPDGNSVELKGPPEANQS